MEAFRKTDIRRKRCLNHINKVWGDKWKTVADPKNLIIPYNYERTLSSIGRIAKKISPEVFRAMLAKGISERLSNWESVRRTGIHIILTDLTYVEKQ